MAQIKAEFLERELKRWRRPDARNFVRPDWRRYVVPGSDAWALYEVHETKFNPEQPRVPGGSREGGQWTNGGESGSRDSVNESDFDRIYLLAAFGAVSAAR
jgi:hypothetical protein